jgi:uncharacterized protein (DUF2147 family)
MKKAIISFILLCMVSFFAITDEADKAIGLWKSISDLKGEEGKVTGIWKLYTTEKGELQGILLAACDVDQTTTYDCDKVEFNGKIVLGYPWMKGLKKTRGDTWSGGTIVDIQSPRGDVYGSEVKVAQGGKVLEMRGYFGIALFGRTQRWLAATEDDVKNYKK